MPASDEATTTAIAIVIVRTRLRTGRIATDTSDVETRGDPISGRTSLIPFCISIGSIGSIGIIVCLKG